MEPLESTGPQLEGPDGNNCIQEDFQTDLKDLNTCAVCLAWGEINSSNSFSGEENNVWRIYNSYDGIAQAGELPLKIRCHFPEVPAERLEPLDTVICTSCFTVVQNVLQIEKDMMQVKSKLLVSKPGTSRSKGMNKKSAVGVANRQTRARRKCAKRGLPEEIIKAELGTEVPEPPVDGEDVVSKISRPSKRPARNTEEKRARRLRIPLKSRLKGRNRDPKDTGELTELKPSDQIFERQNKLEKKTEKPISIIPDKNEEIEESRVKTKKLSQQRIDRTRLTKDNFFCCPKCCQYFAQEDHAEFKNHLSEECFVKKRIPCQLCGHIYSTQNILDYHMIHVHENPHPKSKTMKIKPRKEYVDTVSKLANRVNIGKDALEPESSETLLRNYKELEEDEWPEDESEAERIATRRGIWKCWICFYESKQKSLWNTHMNRIHPDAVGISLTCDSCGIAFTKKFHLREHVHEVHADNTGYTCEDCGRKFMYRNMQHVCEKIECNICGETFDNRGLRSKHLLIHPEFRPFKCEVCPKEFQKREYLTIHMRVHNDIRPYGCEFCEKRFRSKSHYNNHRRLHTGEKPYVCHNCGRSFFSPQCLYNHLTSHTGNKSSVCSTCGKAFRTSNDLKRHEYIHSGEKPFACKFCGKCFNRRGNCLVHERAHEVDGEFKCDLCNLKFEKLKKLEKHKKKIHSPTEGNPKAKGTKSASKSKTKAARGSGSSKITNNILPSDPGPVPQPVAFIHLDDVASNVEISEGILVDEGVEEPISLYQFSFEIDDNTLYCIQERRTDVIP